MKQLLFVLGLICSNIAIGQPCKVHNVVVDNEHPEGYVDTSHPYGISTNPLAPFNPNPPSPNYINTFNWSGINPTTGNLVYLPLSGMNNQTNITLMNNMFSDEGNNPELTANKTWEQLDFHWEDGWELVEMNTGFYPNGQELLPLEQSPFNNNPSIILYNKQRGLLRVFSNFIGATNQPQTVRVMLKFRSPLIAVSGLLRPADIVDHPLDQETNVISLANVVRFENYSNEWFYADFQVGYDPCTCLFNSELELDFFLIHDEDIEMIEHSISVTYDLIDTLGNYAADFLNSTKYDESTGFGKEGLQMYFLIDSLANNYRLQLRKTELINEAIDANNESINKKIALIEALQVVAEIGTAIIFPEGQVVDVIATRSVESEAVIGISSAAEKALSKSQFLTNLLNLPQTNPEVVESISSDGSITLKKKELFQKAFEYMGKGMSFFSDQLKEGLQNNISPPNPPVITQSTSTYSGQISNVQNYGSVKFWNPGTYPQVSGALQLSPLIYPPYNEVLGLFAVLHSPKLERHEQVTNNNLITSTTLTSNGPTLMSNAFEIHNTLNKQISISLADLHGLDYVFNPAAGIDFTSPEFSIQAALLLKGEFNSWEDSSIVVGGKTFFLSHSPTVVHCTNTELTPTFSGNVVRPDTTFSLESPFVPLNNFNSMVQTLNFEFKTQLYISTGDGTSMPLMTNEEMNQLLNTFEAPFDIALDSIQLKVMLNMPFVQPNIYGQTNITTQAFTYDIPLTNITDVSYPMVSFNLAQNPNGNGSLGQTQMLSFGNKSWTHADYVIYGGQNPHHIKPTAWSNIHITGNQNVLNEIWETSFIAGTEIIVSGNSTLGTGINLQLGNPGGISSTSTPSVTADYLDTYCNSSNEYKANTVRDAHLLSQKSEQKSQVNSHKQLLVAYPNPANSQIFIVPDNEIRITNISILNSIGNQIDIPHLPSSLNSNYFELEVSQYATGIYYIKCTLENGEIQVKPFVVTH